MSGSLHNAACSRCGQRAPIVLRGIDARCTACGARRIPFTATALNYAGKATRFGGAAARFVGWASMIGGTAFAAFIALILQSIWPDGFVGYAFAAPTLIVTWAIGIFLLLSGNRLSKSGDAKERVVQLEAIRSMAAHRGGSVTSHQVARTLSLREEEADAILTDLAKTPGENVSLDLDDDGKIYYLFGIEGEELAAARWRIENPELDQDRLAEEEALAYQQATRRRRR